MLLCLILRTLQFMEVLELCRNNISAVKKEKGTAPVR